MRRSRILAPLMLGMGLLGIAAPSFAADTTVAPPRNGSHDFDFVFGTWHTHTHRYKNALSAHPTVIELDGTVTVRRVWGGKAALEEIEADGPDGHWQGMTLFLYNPDTRQWSQSFANSSQSVLQPPTIGAFKGGRGALYAQDSIGGRSILVRSSWSDIRPNSHRYDESYSDDGGQSWKPAFAAELTRIKP
ncbi:MAG: hypothetical protein ABIS14_00670 [Sphingomonas sp.]